MAELDTNFVDAVLSANMNGKKRVRLTQIAENEYIVEDITEYEKVGSEYGQKEINTLNETVNGKVNKVEVIDDLDTVKAVTEDNVPVGCKAVTKFANDVNQSLTLLNEGIQAVSKKQNFCKGSDRLLTDVLQIDFTNPTGESNSYGVIATEDASKLLNSPVTDGAFYAYREVLTIKSVPKDYKVIVRLTEAYPSPGRTWIKAYNPNISDWSDWKVI